MKYAIAIKNLERGGRKVKIRRRLSEIMASIITILGVPVLMAVATVTLIFSAAVPVIVTAFSVAYSSVQLLCINAYRILALGVFAFLIIVGMKYL